MPVGDEYNDGPIYFFSEEIVKVNIELINAHGFDVNRPQLIYEMLLSGKIKFIK
ncbi:MAG: hypothetical protein LBJ23_03975 [Tannerella sp.]|nr:hypothetical protein [Tannerella sp.]